MNYSNGKKNHFIKKLSKIILFNLWHVCWYKIKWQNHSIFVGLEQSWYYRFKRKYIIMYTSFPRICTYIYPTINIYIYIYLLLGIHYTLKLKLCFKDTILVIIVKWCSQLKQKSCFHFTIITENTISNVYP